MTEEREQTWAEVLRSLGEAGTRRGAARRVGKKALALAAMARAGLPVPAAWVLDATHFHAFIERALPRKHDLRTLIKLRGTKAGDERCARAYEELLATAMDPTVVEAVEWLHAEQLGRMPLGVAVRPSLGATGGRSSAATSHLHSRCGLMSARQVVEAIREVWASSVLSHTVAAYADAEVRDIGVAVLMQQTVVTDVRGILTRTTGAGEPVAGADWHLGAPLEGPAGAWMRQGMVLAPFSEGRGAAVRSRAIERLRGALDDRGFEQLREIGAVAEREIGKTAVVHFAVERDGEGSRIHLLGVDEHPRWATLEGGDETTTWVALSLGMRALEPPTRLSQSIVERVAVDSLSTALAAVRCKLEGTLSTSRDGRSYFNPGVIAASVVDAPLSEPEDVIAALGGLPPAWTERLVAHQVRAAGSLWRWPIVGSSAVRELLGIESELLDVERQLDKDARALADMDLTLLPADALSTTMLYAQALLERTTAHWCRAAGAQLAAQLAVRALVRRRVPDAPETVGRALTSGVGGNFACSMAKAFARLLPAVHAEPEVAAMLRSMRTRGAALRRPADLPDGRVRGLLGQLLARYGDLALGSFELSVPRWREDAGELMQMLALALEVPVERLDPLPHEQRARALADAELARYEHELSGLERRALRHLLERYRRLVERRTSVDRLVLRALRLLRTVVIDIDRRLRRIDPLVPAGGAFHCSAERLAAALKTGRPELSRIIRMRTVERSTSSAEPAPPLAFVGSPPRGAIPLVPQDTLVGLGVSPGVVEGRARVVHGVLPDALEPGDVLVITAPDAALAPLCTIAGALVAEVGGVLSPGVELARELALPCVTGVPDAGLHIREGERLRVDGERGTVERVTSLSRASELPAGVGRAAEAS